MWNVSYRILVIPHLQKGSVAEARPRLWAGPPGSEPVQKICMWAPCTLNPYTSPHRREKSPGSTYLQTYPDRTEAGESVNIIGYENQ
ncbi:hypothetical protein AVEN_177378-1 [Araneus ventricosus]|uniref:Uncharacterized protein n=1 Tax=Araneus ventricosus TaxID=182803 RepID=A0A4Y2VUY3_ARAVE|nr:hypothetical protein AVEN_177378-1 [Araneus ventricosus]